MSQVKFEKEAYLNFPSKMYSIKDIAEEKSDGEKIIYALHSQQRPYKWNAEKCEQMFDDLWSFSKKSESHYFFMNQIVVIPMDDCENGYLICDGQQRFVTISIIAMSWVFYFLSNQDALGWPSGIDRQEQNYQKYNERLEIVRDHLLNFLCVDEEFNELRMSVEEVDFLNDEHLCILMKNIKKIMENAVVETEPETWFSGSKSAVTENFLKMKSIWQRKRSLSSSDSLFVADFLQFGEKLYTSCIFLRTNVMNTDHFYQMFNILNRRPLLLSLSDQVKGLIDPICRKMRQRESTTKNWKELVKRIGDDRTDIKNTLNLYARLIFFEKNYQEYLKLDVARKNALIDGRWNDERAAHEIEVQLFEKRNSLTPSAISTFVKNFYEFDSIWIMAQKTTLEVDVERKFRHVYSCLPVLFGDSDNNSRLRDAKAIIIGQYLQDPKYGTDDFELGLLGSIISGNTVFIDFLFESGKKVFSQKKFILDDACKETYVKKILNDFCKNNVYKDSNLKVIMYVLMRIAGSSKNILREDSDDRGFLKDFFHYENETHEIDHIFPQKDAKERTGRENSGWHHSLGNLAVLTKVLNGGELNGKNQTAESVLGKKRDYFSTGIGNGSPFAIQFRDLLVYENWNEYAVESRRLRIIALVVLFFHKYFKSMKLIVKVQSEGKIVEKELSVDLQTIEKIQKKQSQSREKDLQKGAKKDSQKGAKKDSQTVKTKQFNILTSIVGSYWHATRDINTTKTEITSYLFDKSLLAKNTRIVSLKCTYKGSDDTLEERSKHYDNPFGSSQADQVPGRSSATGVDTPDSSSITATTTTTTTTTSTNTGNYHSTAFSAVSAVYDAAATAVVSAIGGSTGITGSSSSTQISSMPANNHTLHTERGKEKEKEEDRLTNAEKNDYFRLPGQPAAPATNQQPPQLPNRKTQKSPSPDRRKSGIGTTGAAKLDPSNHSPAFHRHSLSNRSRITGQRQGRKIPLSKLPSSNGDGDTLSSSNEGDGDYTLRSRKPQPQKGDNYRNRQPQFANKATIEALVEQTRMDVGDYYLFLGDLSLARAPNGSISQFVTVYLSYLLKKCLISVPMVQNAKEGRKWNSSSFITGTDCFFLPKDVAKDVDTSDWMRFNLIMEKAKKGMYKKASDLRSDIDRMFDLTIEGARKHCEEPKKGMIILLSKKMKERFTQLIELYKKKVFGETSSEDDEGSCYDSDDTNDDSGDDSDDTNDDSGDDDDSNDGNGGNFPGGNGGNVNNTGDDGDNVHDNNSRQIEGQPDVSLGGPGNLETKDKKRKAEELQSQSGGEKKRRKKAGNPKEKLINVVTEWKNKNPDAGLRSLPVNADEGKGQPSFRDFSRKDFDPTSLINAWCAEFERKHQTT